MREEHVPLVYHTFIHSKSEGIVSKGILDGPFWYWVLGTTTALLLLFIIGSAFLVLKWKTFPLASLPHNDLFFKMRFVLFFKSEMSLDFFTLGLKVPYISNSDLHHSNPFSHFSTPRFTSSPPSPLYTRYPWSPDCTDTPVSPYTPLPPISPSQCLLP